MLKHNYKIKQLILEDVKNIETKGLSAKYENSEIFGWKWGSFKEFGIEFWF